MAGLVPGRLQPKLPGSFPEDGKVNPLLPSYSMRTVPCVYVSLPQAVGKTLIANRALPCNVWECPHYPPAKQGDLRPIFPRAFTPSKINGAIAKFPHTGA